MGELPLNTAAKAIMSLRMNNCWVCGGRSSKDCAGAKDIFPR